MPNFWGPLALAQPGQYEDTSSIPTNVCARSRPCDSSRTTLRRLVQYFDKGRMELNNVGGPRHSHVRPAGQRDDYGADAGRRYQFESRGPAAISVAGDLDNLFPLYKDLAIPLPPQPLAAGAPVQSELSPVAANQR